MVSEFLKKLTWKFIGLFQRECSDFECVSLNKIVTPELLYLEQSCQVVLLGKAKCNHHLWLGGGTSQSELFSRLARVSERKTNAESGADNEQRIV